MKPDQAIKIAQKISFFQRIEIIKSKPVFVILGLLISATGSSYGLYEFVAGELPRVIISEIYATKDESMKGTSEIFFGIYAKEGAEINNLRTEFWLEADGETVYFDTNRVYNGYLDDSESRHNSFVLRKIPSAVFVCAYMDATFGLKKWAAYKWSALSENRWTITYKSAVKPMTGAYIVNPPDCPSLISKMP